MNLETPKSKQVFLTEKDLRTIIVAREKVKALSAELKAAERFLETVEAVAIRQLQDGSRPTAIAAKKYLVSLEEKTGACRPEWKLEYSQHMESFHNIPKEVAENSMRDHYKPSVKTVLQLVEK